MRLPTQILAGGDPENDILTKLKNRGKSPKKLRKKKLTVTQQ
jgi:hypothetical protein